MYELDIENFVKTSNPTTVERHADSSDFDNTNKVPVVSPKHGKHTLLMDKSCFIEPEKDIYSYHARNKNAYKTTIKMDENNVPLKRYQKKSSSMNHNELVPQPQSNLINVGAKNNNKNRGDQSSLHSIEKSHSKSIMRNKVMPCLSTIFRRSPNYSKHMDCIEEDRTNNINNCGRYCPYHKRQRSSKNTGDLTGYSVQPVYAVKENINGFRHTNTQQVSPTKVKSMGNENYELIYDNSSKYSISDNEPYKKVKHKNIVKEVKQRLEREIKSYYCKQENSRNVQQQFPSKSQIKSPYQVFTSSSCQAKCSSIESSSLNYRLRLPSSSSAFWDFLAGKIKFQVEKAEVIRPCPCTQPVRPCGLATCDYKVSKDADLNISTPSLLPKLPSCLRLTEKPSSGSFGSNKPKKQTQELTKNICKCYSHKNEGKKLQKGSNINITQSMTQVTKPCQEKHEELTCAVAQKYKGEILCIHNPPCVLINGCLNLPPLKPDAAGSYFPVSQTKKSSFSQMCRRIKRSKERKPEVEQASQYQPPYAELQHYLPEFGTEKIIQSVCYHKPPCEIVRGCYKAKYNPKLHTSCIHVPSCNMLPECLLDKTNACQNNTCVHTPRCEELPLCSRKYVALTAKEDVSTQLKPKAKMLCRHVPPCFMIPKCLAHAICSDCIPVGAIPGCVHQPSCEMIPACCRKSAKEMVSVPSQYPNKSCRIV